MRARRGFAGAVAVVMAVALTGPAAASAQGGFRETLPADLPDGPAKDGFDIEMIARMSWSQLTPDAFSDPRRVVARRACDFETVNGVPADGGSMENDGLIVAGGMLFFNAGHGRFGGSPGNVLLAFGVE